MESIWNMSTLVLLVVLLLAVFIGYQKGLIKMLFSLVTLVLTMILTALIFTPVNHFLESQTSLQENISSQIQVRLEESTGKQLETISKSAEESFIAEMPLPAVVKNYLSANNNQAGYVSRGVSTFAQYVSNTAAGFIISVIAFLVTFLIVRLLLYILLSVFHVVEYLPGVKTINHWGGAAVSVGELLIVLWLFCALTAGISGTILGSRLQAIISDNLILGMLYEHNLLLDLLSGVLGF